ncbi:MAG: SH3 domain-containing protein [Caldilineaceae bacterium]
MTNSTHIIKFVRLIRRHWLSGIALLLSILILSKGLPAWAAPALSPVNQTVPQPTATKEATAVPQATNTPHKEKGHSDNNDNNNNNPTATPTPAPQQPPPATAQQPAPGNGLTGVVLAERLNVRQGPGTNFAPIGAVLNGQTVNILSRNATGDWWQICCINNTQTPGWVSAKFIQPNFDAAQANNLIPLAENAPTPAPATATTAPAPATAAPATQAMTPTAASQAATTPVTNTVSAAQAVTSTANAETPTAPGLQLTMEQTPTLVWQGRTLELHFTMTNTTDAKATQVELRDELPQELKFVAAEASNAGKIAPQDGSAGRYVVDIQWPALAAGATVTATVKVQMTENAANGAVIDNLAVAAAANLSSTTVGVSIGLPPASPPDFQ